MKKEKLLRCNICQGKVFFESLKGLVRCQKCGLVMADYRIGNKEIEKLYQKKYFFGDEYIDYVRDRKALEINFGERIKYLTKIGALKNNSRIVEIGSAYGFFLNLIKKRCRWHLGFELSKDGVNYARKHLKVNVTNDDFLGTQEKKVDLVCLWDVVEHLLDPDKYLHKIQTMLVHGGYVALTTGDIGSLMARWQRERWRLIHPPTHLYYFETKTITRILNKNGFSVISIRYCPVYRNLNSIISQVFKKDIKFKLFDKINVPINTFDIMEVVARKI